MTHPSVPADCDVTVIVPTRDSAALLPTCLRSVLNQTHVSAQVIVVDDASTDGSADLAASMLDGLPRTSVVRLPVSVGPGGARNRGFELAAGRWTLFVDSDDFLAPNVLADIVVHGDDRQADFVLFDHALAMPSGETVGNTRSASIAAVGDGVVRAEEALDLLQILPVVWNKLFRTSWFRSLGLAFPPGIYEDMPVTYRAFVDAERIAAVARVGYYYRRPALDDSALTRLDHRHFDVLEQWDRVEAIALGASDALRRALFDRMVDHATYTLEERIAALPAGDFDAYFAGLSRRFAEYRPPGVQPGELKIGAVRARAIGSGRPDAYRKVMSLVRARRRMRTLAGPRLRPARVANGVRSRRAAVEYEFSIRRSGVDPDLAVFMSSWNRYPTGNPLAVSAALSLQRPDVRQMWIVDDDHGAAETASAGFEVVRAGSSAYPRVLARARWFVSDVNFPDYLVRRPGQIHLQTQHGTPLKTMGFDLRSRPQSAGGMNFERLRARCARWDFVISSNPYSSEIWRSAFPFDYEMLEIGYPRNDRLALASAADRVAARKSLGLGDEPVVLYAPTLRDYLSQEPLRLDPARLLADLGHALGEPPSLLMRAHYLRDGLGHRTAPAGVIDVSRHREVETLMIASDVLVTDYSSVMFDYAILGRPIVLYVDDWEEYERSRGTYLDIREEGPGDPVYTQDQLVGALADALSGARDDRRLAAFRDRFCPWDDGRASERAVAAVFSS